MSDKFVSEEQIQEDFEQHLHKHFSMNEIESMHLNSKELLFKFFSGGYIRGCRYSVTLTQELIKNAKEGITNVSS